MTTKVYITAPAQAGGVTFQSYNLTRDTRLTRSLDTRIERGADAVRIVRYPAISYLLSAKTYTSNLTAPNPPGVPVLRHRTHTFTRITRSLDVRITRGGEERLARVQSYLTSITLIAPN